MFSPAAANRIMSLVGSSMASDSPLAASRTSRLDALSRAGFITRRSAEDLTSFRLLEETVRETALERSSRSPDRNVR